MDLGTLRRIRRVAADNAGAPVGTQVPHTRPEGDARSAVARTWPDGVVPPW